MKLSYSRKGNKGGPPRASPGVMHNDYTVSVARMLRLNLYVSEREGAYDVCRGCVIRTTAFTDRESERKRKRETDRGVVVLNGSQTNVQNSSHCRETEGRCGEKETQRTHVFMNGKREADEGESCIN